MEARYQDYMCGNFLSDLSALKGKMTKLGKSSPTIVINRIDEIQKTLDQIVEAVTESEMSNGHSQKEAVYRKANEVYQMIAGYYRERVIKSWQQQD